MSQKTAKLWTIQPLEQWEKLARSGVLRADGRRIFRPYRKAYKWMQKIAARRLSNYGGRTLVWAWITKPDLRRTGHLPKGTAGVRIEFVVPTDRFLLSDFEAWHFVLNGWHLSLSKKEDKERNIEKSWERIFDFKALNGADHYFVGPVERIQAVLEYVSLEEVTRVNHFIAR